MLFKPLEQNKFVISVSSKRQFELSKCGEAKRGGAQVSTSRASTTGGSDGSMQAPTIMPAPDADAEEDLEKVALRQLQVTARGFF